MPLTIPNTTVVSQAYSDALKFAGIDVFAWGFFTIANNPCFVQLFQGPQGQAVPQDEVYCPPATYPITSGARDISGIRFRAATSAVPAPQVFGSLFYPNEPGIQAGTPFTGIITASGGIGGAAAVLDRSTSTVDVAGSAIQTDIYSFPIPAGTLAADSMLDLLLFGDFLHNNAAGDTLRLVAILGGTTLYSGIVFQPAAVSANRYPWEIRLHLAMQGVLNSQILNGVVTTTQPGTTPPAAGQGGVNLAGGNQAVAFGALPSAIDMTLAQTLEVAVTWSAASASNSWRKRYGILGLT